MVAEFDLRDRKPYHITCRINLSHSDNSSDESRGTNGDEGPAALNRTARPSAHNVARLAGVSQAAVSRAFTPGASISQATRERVLVAAKELGYRPNLLARSLIKGHSNIIGVVVGNARNPFFMYALDLISSRLRRAGRHLLVFTGEDHENADLHVQDLLKYRVDGLVLMWTNISPTLADQCRNERIPIVFLGARGSPAAGFATVTGSNAKGARQMADHLLQQGYRKFGYIAGTEHSSTNQEREEAFTTALVSQGLSVPERAAGNFRRAAGMDAARELLSKQPRPDAIFCANDTMALGAIEVARHEFGIEIGRELGIAGFDDVEEAAWPSFQLTTYSHPIDRMIEKITDLLLDSEQSDERSYIVIEGELKIRRSTSRSC